MKAVILSGGKGISLPERKDFISKALIQVNEKPVLIYMEEVGAQEHFLFISQEQDAPEEAYQWFSS